MNLQNELGVLHLDESEKWEKHIEMFYSLIRRLIKLDKPISESNKTTTLLRTFPEFFAKLAMVWQMNELLLEIVVFTIQGEISRREHKTGKLKFTPSTGK